MAAGLKIRLVDVDERGRIAADALAALPLERALALVVSNLFGLAEPIARSRDQAHDAGCAVVDDAAQAFGLHDDDGAVGSRGDLGILSFGRGKPLAALGGGALVGDAASIDSPGIGLPLLSARSTGLAVAKALAYDAALDASVLSRAECHPVLEDR